MGSWKKWKPKVVHQLPFSLYNSWDFLIQGDNWYSLCCLLPWGVSSLFLAPFSFKGERLPCIKKLIFSYRILGQLSSKVQHTNSLSSSTGQSSVFQACIMWVVSVLLRSHEVKCVVCFKDAVQYHAQVIRTLFMWLYFISGRECWRGGWSILGLSTKTLFTY